MLTKSHLRVRMFLARCRSRGLRYTFIASFFHLIQFVRHSTLPKFINFARCKIQKFTRQDRVQGMPYRFVIDPLNVCNLRCPLCPTGDGSLKRARGTMSFEQYKQIIDQVAPYAYYVHLYNWGEPFLHPEIGRIIRYAAERKVMVHISSNLNRFSKQLAREVVQSGLNKLIVSIDGATQQTYEKYRRRGNLATVLANIETLAEAKKELGSVTPFITIRMLVNKYNEHQIDDVRHIADKVGADSFSVSPIFVNTNDKDQIEEWLPQNERLSYYDYSAAKLENVWACADLWESSTINWDGGIAPCCWLQDPAHDFENVFAKPFKEIWNGDAYLSSRRVFGAKHDQLPRKTICATCKGRPEYMIY